MSVRVVTVNVGIVLSTRESQVAADGGCERDVVHRMNDGYRLTIERREH